MPKSRTQLIMEIRQARKDAKANLLYVKGLTKMKKEDLKNIYDELSHIDKRRAQYGETLPEREMVDIERQEDLEEELDKIKKELNDLEDKEEELEAKKVELDELEPDEFEKNSEKDDENDDDYIAVDGHEDDIIDTSEFLKEYVDNAVNNVKKTKKGIESDEEEDVKEVPKKKQSLKSYEKEIREMMREFEDNIHDILMEFNDKEELDKKDIDEIMDYHNELRDIIKHNLEKIYDEIPDELDFSEAFYKYMDRVFKKQEDKIDNFIS